MWEINYSIQISHIEMCLHYGQFATAATPEDLEKFLHIARDK